MKWSAQPTLRIFPPVLRARRATHKTAERTCVCCRQNSGSGSTHVLGRAAASFLVRRVVWFAAARRAPRSPCSRVRVSSPFCCSSSWRIEIKKGAGGLLGVCACSPLAQVLWAIFRNKRVDLRGDPSDFIIFVAGDAPVVCIKIHDSIANFDALAAQPHVVSQKLTELYILPTRSKSILFPQVAKAAC